MAGQRRSERDLVAAMKKHVTIESPTAGHRAAVEDGGTDLAEARARAAVAAGRPLRGTEKREVRQQVLAQHAGARPAAGGRRPSIRERLEAMNEDQRDAVIASM